MKTVLIIIVMSIAGVCLITSCAVLPWAVGKIADNPLEKGWSHKAHLEYLMNHPKKQLLTEDEKQKASQSICKLEHLDTRKKINYKEAKVFCKLEKDDKIYFLKDCIKCGGAVGTKDTSYLLVRDGKPFESIRIETKLNRELKKNIPIIERLH